jgi:hypothetical protein
MRANAGSRSRTLCTPDRGGSTVGLVTRVEVSLLIGQSLICGSRSLGGEVLCFGWRGRVVIAGGLD